MVDQGALTVIVPIKDGEAGKLAAFLKGIGDIVDLPECPIRFEQLTTVHFMRWVVLPVNQDFRGTPTPASLILSTNYDQPLKNHLAELVKVVGPVLDQIYSHCKGYEGLDQLLPYLRAHSVSPAAFYVGTRGRGVVQVRQEAQLHQEIEKFLDGGRASAAGQDPDKVRSAIQTFVSNQPGLDWARKRPSLFRWYLHLYRAPILFLLALVAAYVLPPLVLGWHWWALPLATGILLALLVVALWLGRRALMSYEKQDHEAPVSNNIPHVETLVEREDQVVQNQLSHLVNVKPEWFRRPLLKAVLKLIGTLGHYIFVRGALGGIPTIHFARWVLIDEGRRLLFFSNFDGSWENYLGDFIDKAASGLTAVWSNTQDCPRAEGLIGAGARDEQRFKSWTRDHQIFTQVWYSAYDTLTVDNINNNSKIRLGLYGRLSPAATREWLSRL